MTEAEWLAATDPVPMLRLSALKKCCSPFSITIDRPNVTMSVASSPLFSAAWMTLRCTA